MSATTRLRACVSLVQRDVLLLVRRPSRIVATVLTPALFWAFFASGFTDAIAENAADANSYTLSLAAGAALLVVTFTSIFGALGLIRDRETGFLQAVLVGPTPRWVIMLSKVASGTLVALVQASVMLVAATAIGEGVEPFRVAGAGAVLACSATGLSGVCAASAWHFRSIEGFHGVMAAVLMPAWLLSGAVFPPGTTRGVLGAVMAANPLSYTHSAMYGLLSGEEPRPIALGLTVLFAAIGCVAPVVAARGDAKR